MTCPYRKIIDRSAWWPWLCFITPPCRSLFSCKSTARPYVYLRKPVYITGPCRNTQETVKILSRCTLCQRFIMLRGWKNDFYLTSRSCGEAPSLPWGRLDLTGTNDRKKEQQMKKKQSCKAKPILFILEDQISKVRLTLDLFPPGGTEFIIVYRFSPELVESDERDIKKQKQRTNSKNNGEQIIMRLVEVCVSTKSIFLANRTTWNDVGKVGRAEEMGLVDY